MTLLFGFAQLDLAGRLALADGRYVIRAGGRERVLVIETLGAPPPSRRRRRRARDVEAGDLPTELPLARVTAVRAFEPFEDEGAATAWLAATSAEEEAVDRLVGEAIDDLNAALHAHAVAGGDPHLQVASPDRAVTVRIGYGSGEQLADGLFAAALQVDPARGPASRRRARAEELRPQQRLAAILGGRERPDACETLLLRARADLNANRTREAALQLRVGLEALLAELPGTLDDPDHKRDMATLTARRKETGELADAALAGDLDPSQQKTLRELLETCERVLRRRRVLGG